MSSSLEKFINHTSDSDEDEFEKQLEKKEKRQRISLMKIGNEEDLNTCSRQACRILEGMGRLKV